MRSASACDVDSREMEFLAPGCDCFPIADGVKNIVCHGSNYTKIVCRHRIILLLFVVASYSTGDRAHPAAPIAANHVGRTQMSSPKYVYVMHRHNLRVA